MSIITCDECGGRVSDKAASCPHCGGPIALRDEISQPETTIQSTSKGLKAHNGLALILVCIGFLVMFVPIAAGEEEPPAIGSVLFVAGLVWYIVTRFRIWWNHS